jgi:hypothetical protein
MVERLDDNKLFRDIVAALRATGRIAASESAGLASRTLEDSTQSRVSRQGTHATITFDWPYYWAAFLHDGRGATSPKRATHIIYFRDPSDDPRIASGYPKRKADIRRLTKDEFRFWQNKNAIARANNQPVPMVVTKTAGPFEGRHFLTVPASPMRDFERAGADKAAEQAALEFTKLLDEDTSFTAKTTLHL